MTPEQVIAEIEPYEAELSRIYRSFRRTREGIYIAEGDDALYRQYVRELLLDLYNDALGRNVYSARIANEFQNGFGYLGSPSIKGVENVLGVVRASLTRLRRNPDLLILLKSQESTRKRENLFIIHGKDGPKNSHSPSITLFVYKRPEMKCVLLVNRYLSSSLRFSWPG